jgi:hypothetical protein
MRVRGCRVKYVFLTYTQKQGFFNREILKYANRRSDGGSRAGVLSRHTVTNAVTTRHRLVTRGKAEG